MDPIFNETDDSEENLSKISSKSVKCNSFSDIRTMNEDVSFSMIVDKDSHHSDNNSRKFSHAHSQPILDEF
ncbi:unnamed protein product [marine sediment metagenome]|uniref:Uncharacterized protein n=1 Tax=marine sediment metagenome TaxID=412755 RepID=X1CEE5_9ZZZZ